MATRPRRALRFDLGALTIALIVVLGLLAVLLVRMDHDRDAAAAAEYPQLSQPSPTVAVPTVAFIGDSYSAGTGSSGYNSRFTTLVAAYEGWSSSSFASGGTGYLRSATSDKKTGCGAEHCPSYGEVIARVRNYDPTIVFVSGGRNDVGLPEAEVERAIERFYSDLRTALPNARIIVTSPLWAYSTPPAELSNIQQFVRQAATSAHGTYLDLGEPLVDNRALVSSDRVHPNNRGHAVLAQAMEVGLSRADASSTP